MSILGTDKMLEIAATTVFTFLLETTVNKVGEKLMENTGGEETNHVNHENKGEKFIENTRRKGGEGPRKRGRVISNSLNGNC